MKFWMVMFEEGGDNVVGFQQQTLYNAQSNEKGSETSPWFPILSIPKEVVSKHMSKPHIHSQHQMCLQENIQISKKSELDTKWPQTFYKANILICIVHYHTFIAFMRASNKAQILYKLLAYHAMRICFSWWCTVQYQKFNAAEDKTSIHKYGYNICSDG